MTTTTAPHLRLPFAVGVLLLLSCMPARALPNTDPRDSLTIRSDFMRAMDEATERLEQRDHQASLVQRLLQRARPTQVAFTTMPEFREHELKRQEAMDRSAERDLANNNNGNYYNYNNNGNYNQNKNYNGNYYYNKNGNYYNNNGNLNSNYYNNGNYYNNNRNYNNNYNYNNQQQQAAQEEEDQDDTYDFDDAFDYGSLDLTQYALKYMGCQNIHTWSDSLAALDDGEQDEVRGTSDSGVLAMDRFVVFRLCPKDSCSNYNLKGCSSNYGEYMIPMEDYLRLTNKYHMSKFNQYCNTCTKCMASRRNLQQLTNDPQQRELDNNYWGGGQYTNYNGKYNSNANNKNNYNYNKNNYNNQRSNNYYQNNGGNDDGYAAAAANDDAAAAANDDAVNDDAAAAAASSSTSSSSSTTTCEYETACKDYQAACQDYDASTASDDYSQYFTCTRQYVGNVLSYLGPRCQSDGFSLAIGVYSDSGCNTYVQDLVDLQQGASGGKSSTNRNYLKTFSPKQCISCQASESFDLSGNDGMYPICGYLYQKSAKCHKNLGKSDSYNGRYQQEANEDDVCNFVASLVENNYNEYGEIILEDQELTLSNWKKLNAYRRDVGKVTKVQLVGILFSVGLVVLLSGYIAYLQYKLKHRSPWIAGRLRTGYPGASSLSRINSGITMQRSMSGLEPTTSTGSWA